METLVPKLEGQRDCSVLPSQHKVWSTWRTSSHLPLSMVSHLCYLLHSRLHQALMGLWWSHDERASSQARTRALRSPWMGLVRSWLSNHRASPIHTNHSFTHSQTMWSMQRTDHCLPRLGKLSQWVTDLSCPGRAQPVTFMSKVLELISVVIWRPLPS